MRADALAQIAALADIERKRIQAVEQIDAGRLRQRVERIGRELRRQAGNPEHALAQPPRSRPRRCRGRAPATNAHSARASPSARWRPSIGKRVALDHAVEIVPLGVRKHPARQLDGAQHARAEAAVEARERVLQKAVVEARVVRDEQRAGGARGDLVRDGVERRGVAHHRVGDAGQRLNGAGNRHARDSRASTIRDTSGAPPAGSAVTRTMPDLGDRIAVGRGSRRLEVDEGEGGRKQVHGERTVRQKGA